MLRGLKQTLYALGARDPTETDTELCLSISCGGAGQQWSATGTGALGIADLVMAQALLEVVAINPTKELPKQDGETEPCAPGPRRKEQWPHKRLTQTCL